MSDAPQGPGWWQASDGRYYPPTATPGPPGAPSGASGPNWIRQQSDEQKSAQNANGCLIAVGVVAALAVVLVVVTMIGKSAGGDHGDEDSAVVMCHQFVEKRLKAPATAGFENTLEVTVQADGTDQWIVDGHVDAENTFGANVRTTYTCTIKYVGDDEWRLVDLDMD